MPTTDHSSDIRIVSSADYSNEDMDQFYKQISDINNALPQHDINVIMGNLNAKLGKDRFVTNKFF